MFVLGLGIHLLRTEIGSTGTITVASHGQNVIKSRILVTFHDLTN